MYVTIPYIDGLGMVNVGASCEPICCGVCVCVCWSGSCRTASGGAPSLCLRGVPVHFRELYPLGNLPLLPPSRSPNFKVHVPFPPVMQPDPRVEIGRRTGAREELPCYTCWVGVTCDEESFLFSVSVSVDDFSCVSETLRLAVISLLGALHQKF